MELPEKNGESGAVYIWKMEKYQESLISTRTKKLGLAYGNH